METREQENLVNDEVLIALDELKTESSETNDRLLELHEYLADKDEQEKKAEEENLKVQEEEQKQNAEIQEQKDSENQALNEVYTEQLTEINESVQLTNQLLTVQGVYIGIIIGFLFIKILFDRLRK